MVDSVTSPTDTTTTTPDLPDDYLSGLVDQLQQQQLLQQGEQAMQQVLGALFSQILNKITSEANE